MKRRRNTYTTKEEGIAILDSYKRIDCSTNCWRFKYNPNKDGWARIRVNSRTESLHRLSAILYLNLDSNSDLLALHKTTCPNRDCFNPDHLYIGTHKDNTRDAVNTRHLVSGFRAKLGYKLERKYE